jgi:hypothetical protein
MSVVITGAAADEVAINHARRIHVDSAANFQVELAFGDRCHAAAFDDPCRGRNLDSMANRGDREVV